MMRKTGIDLITAERRRQMEMEGFDAGHDDEHYNGELALVAALYATPTPLFGSEIMPGFVRITDPWPESWSDEWDKRRRTKSGKLIFREGRGRIRDLAKAGALIAAEIDRLLRMKSKTA